MKKLFRTYLILLTLVVLFAALTTTALAVDDMWTVANRIIVDVYNKIAGISTVLAGLMSAVAVVGAKLSNNWYLTSPKPCSISPPGQATSPSSLQRC